MSSKSAFARGHGLGLLVAALTIAMLRAGDVRAEAPLMSQDEAQIARGSRIPPLFLDVRTAGEFAEGHIPDAYNVPVGEVAARIEEIIEEADGSPIVVYGEHGGEHGGGRAARAEAELVGAGLGQVLHLKGDMSAWRAAALPVETGAP